MGQYPVAHHPARLLQHLLRGSQVAADVAGAVGGRGLVGAREHLRRNPVAISLQYPELPTLRKPGRGKLGIGEEALRAGVLAVEQVRVAPLEVERMGQRMAHAPVGEFRPSRVEPERLHAGGDLVVDQLPDHPAVRDVREVVGGAPFLRVVLAAEVELAGLERLDRDGGVAVVVVANDVDVVLSAVDREVAAPVVGHALQRDGPAGLDRRDAVGTAAQRRLEGGRFEVAPLPPVLRQDVDLPDDERQLAVHGVAEGEPDGARSRLRDAGDVRVIVAIERVPLRPQGLGGPDHVFHRHRTAVVPARLLAQRERHPRPVRRHVDGFHQQPVLGERLVQGARQQVVVDQPRARGGVPLEDEGVEVVEGPERGEPELAPTGSVRVGVVEVLELRTVLDVVEHRQGMGPGEVLRRERRGSGGGCDGEGSCDDQAADRVPHGVLLGRLHGARAAPVQW